MMGMKNSTFCYEMNGGIRHFGHRIGEIKVAEHSFGSFMSIYPLPNHGKRKVAAHKLKLGK